MPRKNNPNVPNKKPENKDAFITWGSTDPVQAAKANLDIGNAIDSIRPVVRSTASVLAPGTLNARHGLSKFDYELFRPGERTSFHFRGILEACMAAYERISIVRNAIDSMGDFTSQGIKIVHPDPGIEKFYQNWWAHVNGDHISERFANLFYLTGNPIIRRNMAKVPTSILDALRTGKAVAAPLMEDNNNVSYFDDFFHEYDRVPEKPVKPTRNLIPWEYDFLNPLFVSLMNEELALFSGNKTYGLDLPESLISRIKSPKNSIESDMVSDIPDYIRNAALNGSKTIPLDPSRVSVYHYKKHSWQAWAYPLIYAVMDELIILQKLKMADLAALDGACSQICVWKLGNIDAKMFPSQAMIDKLAGILEHAGNGQRLDIIWGPDIDFKETSSDFSKFLGKDKYIPTLESFYAGVGIPPSLTGTGGSGGGSTNSFLSLKVLIERLNYGRDALTRFWNGEIKTIQETMGFRKPAKIEFKNMILSDESAQQHLLINLLDRDVISLERVREHFGYIPEIEESNIRKEYRDRVNKKIPPKASGFHDANGDFSLEKIFAQTGAITPGQTGIELDPKGPDEVAPIDLQQQSQKLQEDQFSHQKKITTVQTKQDHQLNLQKQKDDTSVKKMAIKHGLTPDGTPPGEPGQGRPKNSTDTQPRKQRSVKASIEENRDLITLQVWATSAQETIGELVNPKFLKKCNKKNMRSLTTAETEEVEHLKWVMLCNVEPFTQITEETVKNLLMSAFPANTEADGYWRVCVASLVARTGSTPTIDEIKQIQSYVYALCKGNYENGKNHD